MTTRILLVEDDPTTAAFLAAAVQGVPAEVDVAGSCAAALALAGYQDRHDLWLIDANLPDGDGTGLLSSLRARGLRAPALAHTAALEPGILAALRETGFREVLVKPLPATTLQVAVRDALGLRVGELPPPAFHGAAVEQTWDDAAALAALNGERAHVYALRKLFVGELPGACAGVDAAARAGDVDTLRAALHRLRASCGFVGAARLAASVAALQQAPRSGEALARFLAAAQDTLSSASVADEA